MDKKVILTNEGARQFSHALELLNSSIREFNQIADKMIPEKLITDGLASYLNDFCKILESESGLKATFSCSGVNIKAKEDIETAIFRSLRILVVMFIKISQPAHIHFSLNKSNNFVNLIIKDDGIKNILKNPDFLVRQELENIQSILNTYSGNFKVNSNVTTGNEIEIQVPF